MLPFFFAILQHFAYLAAMNKKTEPRFRVALAESAEDLRAAQRLRYDVFVRELGAGGSLVDHEQEIEQDQYDSVCDHLLLFDDAMGRVVGVYRLLSNAQARAAGRFYSEGEFDLSALKNSGRRLLELGRSCLAADYRGGSAMYHLWNGLSSFVKERKIDILFGVASFHGTDTKALAEPLSLLHHRHLAPEGLRPFAVGDAATRMDLINEDQIDRRAAMVQIPALIKAYLRLGGVVGQGAWVDHAFRTTDVCLILDTSAVNARQRHIYAS